MGMVYLPTFIIKINHTNQPNVGKNTIHGSNGIDQWVTLKQYLLILSKTCRDVDNTKSSLMETQLFSDSA